MNMEKHVTLGKIGIGMVVLALLMGCSTGGDGGGGSGGSGGSGGGSGNHDTANDDTSSSRASNDIYNPAAYEVVWHGEIPGVYILIQDGTRQYDGGHTQFRYFSFVEGESDIVVNDRLRIREAVRIVERGGDYALEDICTGRELGLLNGQIDFELIRSGLFRAQYRQYFEVQPMVSEADWTPLMWTFAVIEEDGGEPRTDLSIETDFHLVRIGEVGSTLGAARLNHVLGGVAGQADDLCVTQIKWDIHWTFPDLSFPNEADITYDWLYTKTSSQNLHFDLIHGQGDAVIPGVGPIGTGRLATFSIEIETPAGMSSYTDQLLTSPGETGEVSHSVTADNTWGINLSGQIVPNDSGKYHEGSVPASYQFEWRLK